jgi:hypothetical protein
MTRARIVDGLELLVLGLANPGTVGDPPDGWSSQEWAYVKGLASAELIRLVHLVGAE